MSDRFDVLERFAPMFEAPEPSFERFLRRRDRKRRNQRIAAGVVGIAVFVAAILLVTSSSVDRTRQPATELEPPPRAPIAIGTGSADGWDWLLSASANGECVALTDAQGSHVNCVTGPSPYCQRDGVSCPADFVFDGAYYSPRPPAPSLVFSFGRVPTAAPEV